MMKIFSFTFEYASKATTFALNIPYYLKET